MDTIRIIVALHKEYTLPSEDVYYPLRVGAAGASSKTGKENPGFYDIPGDDTGNNISLKNPVFCELTAVYWAWKNLDADFYGLVHYRRYLKGMSGILSGQECRELLSEQGYRILLPEKQNYLIESLYSHYKHTHYEEHLIKTREVIEALTPEYLETFDKVLRRTSGYMFNMFVMDRALFGDYCDWLFRILFALEQEIPMGELSVYHARFAGRISEIIFNVWLEYRIGQGQLKREEIKELPVYYTEEINWWKKGKSFLAAKFFGKKYEGSF